MPAPADPHSPRKTGGCSPTTRGSPTTRSCCPRRTSRQRSRGSARPVRPTALAAQVELAKLEAGKGALPAALQQRVQADVARADRETTDVYARQAVISGAAELLTEAGMIDASDALLTAELQRSSAPYYY